jgi:hypothetical protein
MHLVQLVWPRLDLSVAARFENALLLGDNLLQSGQPFLKLDSDFCLGLTELGVEGGTVRASLHGELKVSTLGSEEDILSADRLQLQ